MGSEALTEKVQDKFVEIRGAFVNLSGIRIVRHGEEWSKHKITIRTPEGQDPEPMWPNSYRVSNSYGAYTTGPITNYFIRIIYCDARTVNFEYQEEFAGLNFSQTNTANKVRRDQDLTIIRNALK